MQLYLVTLAAYMALAKAATVTVTQTVVVSTEYVTRTIYESPSTSTSPATSSTVSSESSEVIISVPSSSSVITAVPSSATASSSTSSSSSSTSSEASLNSFEAEALSEHNKKRALHGAPPLEWDPVLAQYGADYAARAFDCNNVQLIHSGGPYGENLNAGSVGGIDPVDSWYSEISLYNYSNPVFSGPTGHFTQLVWASTTKVGCAMVKCDNIWRQYTICEYSPRGNVRGGFADNVLPLIN